MAMTSSESEDARPRPSFKATLLRVLAVQVVSLILLWLLQSRYGG